MRTFDKRFRNDDDCLAYLASLKWKGESYTCPKCGNTTYHKGRSPYSRRCNRCKYDESVTCGTIFHKLRFPMLTAFRIINRMATSNKGNTATELSEQYGISYKTCLEFRHKVQSVMRQVSPQKLKGDVGIGFFNIYNEDDPYFYWLQRKEGQKANRHHN